MNHSPECMDTLQVYEKVPRAEVVRASAVVGIVVGILVVRL